ncbi:hypothetical protein FA95DRAFT_1682117 [Auriscalpium vulgare]|uniref:Uncharacterized protein n=1 Tax=Auriscalpium vulgare TaxID=40419 RepID=A0ACB8RG56_9AGAM|nr:hypothetical protein FA95DRAFT_1682117 [Auriscalpium vulgare]
MHLSAIYPALLHFLNLFNPAYILRTPAFVSSIRSLLSTPTSTAPAVINNAPPAAGDTYLHVAVGGNEDGGVLFPITGPQCVYNPNLGAEPMCFAIVDGFDDIFPLSEVEQSTPPSLIDNLISVFRPKPAPVAEPESLFSTMQPALLLYLALTLLLFAIQSLLFAHLVPQSRGPSISDRLYTVFTLSFYASAATSSLVFMHDILFDAVKFWREEIVSGDDKTESDNVASTMARELGGLGFGILDAIPDAKRNEPHPKVEPDPTYILTPPGLGGSQADIGLSSTAVLAAFTTASKRRAARRRSSVLSVSDKPFSITPQGTKFTAAPTTFYNDPPLSAFKPSPTKQLSSRRVSVSSVVSPGPSPLSAEKRRSRRTYTETGVLYAGPTIPAPSTSRVGSRAETSAFAVAEDRAALPLPASPDQPKPSALARRLTGLLDSNKNVDDANPTAVSTLKADRAPTPSLSRIGSGLSVFSASVPDTSATSILSAESDTTALDTGGNGPVLVGLSTLFMSNQFDEQSPQDGTSALLISKFDPLNNPATGLKPEDNKILTSKENQDAGSEPLSVSVVVEDWSGALEDRSGFELRTEVSSGAAPDVMHSKAVKIDTRVGTWDAPATSKRANPSAREIAAAIAVFNGPPDDGRRLYELEWPTPAESLEHISGKPVLAPTEPNVPAPKQCLESAAKDHASVVDVAAIAEAIIAEVQASISEVCTEAEIVIEKIQDDADLTDAEASGIRDVSSGRRRDDLFETSFWYADMELSPPGSPDQSALCLAMSTLSLSASAKALAVKSVVTPSASASFEEGDSASVHLPGATVSRPSLFVTSSPVGLATLPPIMSPPVSDIDLSGTWMIGGARVRLPSSVLAAEAFLLESETGTASLEEIFGEFMDERDASSLATPKINVVDAPATPEGLALADDGLPVLSAPMSEPEFVFDQDTTQIYGTVASLLTTVDPAMTEEEPKASHKYAELNGAIPLESTSVDIESSTVSPATFDVHVLATSTPMVAPPVDEDLSSDGDQTPVVMATAGIPVEIEAVVPEAVLVDVQEDLVIPLIDVAAALDQRQVFEPEDAAGPSHSIVGILASTNSVRTPSFASLSLKDLYAKSPFLAPSPPPPAVEALPAPSFRAACEALFPSPPTPPTPFSSPIKTKAASRTSTRRQTSRRRHRSDGAAIQLRVRPMPSLGLAIGLDDAPAVSALDPARVDMTCAFAFEFAFGGRAAAEEEARIAKLEMDAVAEDAETRDCRFKQAVPSNVDVIVTREVAPREAAEAHESKTASPKMPPGALGDAPDLAVAGIVVTATGEQIVPAQPRPDGSMRKELKIRPGFVAQEAYGKYLPPPARVRTASEAPAYDRRPRTHSEGPSVWGSRLSGWSSPRAPPFVARFPNSPDSPYVQSGNWRVSSANPCTTDSPFLGTSSRFDGIDSPALGQRKQSHDSLRSNASRKPSHEMMRTTSPAPWPRPDPERLAALRAKEAQVVSESAAPRTRTSTANGLRSSLHAPREGEQQPRERDRSGQIVLPAGTGWKGRAPRARQSTGAPGNW